MARNNRPGVASARQAAGAACGRLLLVAALLHPALGSRAPEPVLAHAPEVCGSWQHAYAAMHREILAGQLPPRYAVHVAPKSGFSDRLVGMVSVFFYALLTRRAIVFWAGPDERLPRMELAFEGPHVNWSAAQPYADMLGPVPEGYYVHPDMEGGAFIHRDLVSAGDALFADGDLDDVGREVETVLLTMHRGRSISLFGNPRHAPTLYALGLHRENAFGCAMDFLFRPHAGIRQMFGRELAELEDAGAFKIGIQVRVGDRAVLDPGLDEVGVGQLQCYLKCAEEVEAHWRAGHARTVWYVLSDSVHVRRRVQELYGDKVLTRTDVAVEHTASGVDPDVAEGTSVTAHGFRAAVWENWLLGMTDVQVISYGSGFGRSAAFRSLPDVTFYTCSINEPAMQCGPKDATPLRVAGADYSGI